MSLVTTKDEIEAALKCGKAADALSDALILLEQCEKLSNSYYSQVYVERVKTQSTEVNDVTLLKAMQPFLETPVFRSQLEAYIEKRVAHARIQLAEANAAWSNLE